MSVGGIIALVILGFFLIGLTRAIQEGVKESKARNAQWSMLADSVQKISVTLEDISKKLDK